MKVTFFERLGSYIVDSFIISIIFTIICLGFSNNISETEKKMQELDDKLIASEVTTEEYYNEYKTLLYDYQKENILQSGISVALTIAYFVIFQYMNKGQTIGKMLLKLRVVDKDTNKPISILKGFLRTFIVYSILSGTLLLILPYIFNANSFIYSYFIIVILEGIFTLISIMLVLYKKDGRGLHEIMTNTMVIKESR